MSFYWVCSSCNTKHVIYTWIDRCEHCGKQWNGDMKDIVFHGYLDEANKKQGKKAKAK